VHGLEASRAVSLLINCGVKTAELQAYKLHVFSFALGCKRQMHFLEDMIIL